MTAPGEARRPVTWGRWILVIMAAFLGATVVSTLLLLQCAPGSAASTPVEPYRPPASPDDSAGTVRVEMRNVDYHVDPDIVLHIRYLRGEVVSSRDGEPAVFEDGRTYSMRILSAEIFVDTASLALLINRQVFGYRRAPIRDLHLAVEGNELIQKGKLGTLPFTIRSKVSLIPSGEIRLHPVDVKVLGINADGLMDKLGLELDEMVKVPGDRGIRIEENDFILNVAAVLPPPRILGRLSAVELVPGGMIQRFGPADSLPARRFFGDTTLVANYMAYRGSTIRFGKLTMVGTDLTIIDADPGDRFDFYLGRYHEQLVAGTHRTTPEDGLVVRMPDLSDIRN